MRFLGGMAVIVSTTLESFSLRSSWFCSAHLKDGIWVWSIKDRPTMDGKTLVFPVSLPADAVIRRAWLSMEMGYPFSGAAWQAVNDIQIPSSGEVDVEGITAETTEFSASYSFRANGVIYTSSETHTSTLYIGNPTLNIEYTSESQEMPPVEDDPGNIDRKEDVGLQLPRLLDANLVELDRLTPSRLSIDLQINPLSTATMETHGTKASVRDFVELFDPTGSIGIFRVSKVENLYGSRGGQKLYLKHGMTTLSDTLAVGVQAMTGTFGEVISTLLDAQTVKHWVLGDVDLPDEYEVVYSYRYDNLFQAINDIYEMLPDGYAWSFDMLRHPWVMHLRRLSDDDLCECRIRRNIENVTISIDSANLCTRVYPFGTGEGQDRINLSTLTGALFLDADTKGVWGTVAKTFTDDNIFDSITLKDVAALYLDSHKDPTVSVTVDAMALYAMTGEPLDRFRLGRLCRLPMPDYGVIMSERVVSIRYDDVYGRPDKATLTLANRIRTVSDDIADLIREASSSKLIGGTVETTEVKNDSKNITTTSSQVTTFQVTGYGNLLAAKVRYTASIVGEGTSARCRVRVDGTSIQDAQDMAQPIDILRYLTTDDSGVPTVGDHTVELSPVASSSSVNHWVHCTVILKTIEKN